MISASPDCPMTIILLSVILLSANYRLDGIIYVHSDLGWLAAGLDESLLRPF